MGARFKRCPFCMAADVGVVEEIQQDVTGDDMIAVYMVECNACSATGPFSHEEDQAVRLWNHRWKLGEAKEREH